MTVAKAVVGALVAGVSSPAGAVASGGGVTLVAGLAAVIATLVALQAVWATPNKPSVP